MVEVHSSEDVAKALNEKENFQKLNVLKNRETNSKSNEVMVTKCYDVLILYKDKSTLEKLQRRSTKKVIKIRLRREVVLTEP